MFHKERGGDCDAAFGRRAAVETELLAADASTTRIESCLQPQAMAFAAWSQPYSSRLQPNCRSSHIEMPILLTPWVFLFVHATSLHKMCSIPVPHLPKRVSPCCAVLCRCLSASSSSACSSWSRSWWWPSQCVSAAGFSSGSGCLRVGKAARWLLCLLERGACPS